MEKTTIFPIKIQIINIKYIVTSIKKIECFKDKSLYFEVCTFFLKFYKFHKNPWSEIIFLHQLIFWRFLNIINLKKKHKNSIKSDVGAVKMSKTYFHVVDLLKCYMHWLI